MSHIASIRAVVLAAAILWASPAHAGAIVFDFAGGIQGWELSGAAGRVTSPKCNDSA